MLHNQASAATKTTKDHRKQQLIDATIKTISHYGLSKTTVAKVTKTANLSMGIVGFYFKSKEQLLLSTLQALADEFRYQTEAVINTSSSPMQTLRAVVDVHFDTTLCDVEKIAVWFAFTSESNARQEYMKICGDQDRWHHQLLLENVQALCIQADMSKASAVAVSRGLEGLIDGFWQDYLYQPDDFDRNTAKQTGYDYLDTLFPSTDKGHEPIFVSELKPEYSDCLPTWTYNDTEFLELEKQELFKKNWLLVGHINDMPKPRDYLTLDALGERAVVIRGNDNEIRAFHNVCRHRGAKLVDNSNGQCANALTCPFHGWTYQLDGKLISVPAEHTFSGLNKSKRGLVPIDLEIWMGFVFVRFVQGDNPTSLNARMKSVESQFAPYRLDEMIPLRNTRCDEIRPYNWKVIHDVDNEGYHVPLGHPSLHQLYGKDYSDHLIDGHPVSYGVMNEKSGKLWSVKNYQNLLPRFDHLPEENQRTWLYGFIFPTMGFGLYPDSIEFYMSIPIAPDKTLFRSGGYALPDSRRCMKAVRYLNRRINTATDQEDESFVRWLYEGMESSVFPEPNLSSIEHIVREYHHQIQTILPVAKLKHHPGSGNVAQTNAKILELAGSH